MTDVAITWDRPDRGGQSGTVRFTPTARYFRDDTRVTDAPVTVTVLPGQTAIASLDPTGLTWCYHVEWIPDGTDAPPWSEWVTVEPDPDRPLDQIPYHRLPQLTRDAAALLTGERARTAAGLLTDVQAEGGQLRQLAQQTTAEAAAALDGANSAATSAQAAAELSQASALSVLPMVAGSVAAAAEAGTVPVDLGRAVNTVAAGLGFVDVTFPPVTTPSGQTDPDGLGTLLHVTGGASGLTWPGGTVVHGRPPVDGEAFATVVRVAGAVHVVWSAVDQTPPPDSGATGNGAIQASLSAVLRRGVSLPPGGTVVSDSAGFSVWQFTNLQFYQNKDVTLTHGNVQGYLYKELTPSEYVYVAGKAGPFSALQTSMDIGFSTGVPETGSGVVVAVSSIRPAAGGQGWAWGGIRRAFRGLAYDIPADTSKPEGERWLVVPITTKSMSAGMVSSGNSLSFSKNNAMDVFSPTEIESIAFMGFDDAYLSEQGITMAHRVLTPAEMTARKPAGVTW